MPVLRSSVSEQTRFLFELDYKTDDRVSLGREPLPQREFDRAVFATYFEALQQGRIDEYCPQLDHSLIEPLLVTGAEPGRTHGFRVSFELPSGTHEADYGLGYFAARAGRRQAALVREKTLSPEASVTYQLDTYCDDLDESSGRIPFTLGEASISVPIRDGRLAELGDVTAWDESEATDPPVVIARPLIDEMLEATRAAPEQEIGGILLGHVRREPSTAELFLQVTEWVSCAGTTDATALSVTFTPESFRRARDLIRLRDQGEIIIGWQHSHPMRLCAECPLPIAQQCISKVLFYSQDDVQLMETTFPQPFQLGLLTAVEPRLDAALGHPPVRLFGWRHAEIQPRGFLVAKDE